MSNYTPDRWVVLEFVTPHETIRKVFAGWYGGFTGSDSWKLNSGIENTHMVDGVYAFEGYSGSTYYCHPHGYGMSGYQTNILTGWIEDAESMPGWHIRILGLEEVAEMVV